MNSHSGKLELLAPARNLDQGIEAINHGADAVYIGGPAFGARAAAGNTVSDIEQLAAYAHRYSARVFVAFNTILDDQEIEEAHRLTWQIYEAGADALIVQDMGLLELDLPPIQLHASTQTDNRSVEKAKFLEQVGFSQIVLARELSLEQIRAIAAQTTATLEFFVHGALCVSYSGQCYISHAHSGRSANRGQCSQACRLPYTLMDEAGAVVAQERHLLSIKDNDQSANLRALAEAGIRSFKIEGRLKELAYVKNVTAHYRRLLDLILEEVPSYVRASAGHCGFFFEPDPKKTFNRGATDYFVHERRTDLGAFESPGFVGEPVGRVAAIGRNYIDVDATVPLHNGDGIAFVNARDEVVGVRINRVEASRLFPAEPVAGLAVGQALFRNHDQEFHRLLTKKSAERRIAVRMCLEESADGFTLHLTDEEGITVAAGICHPREPAREPGVAAQAIREQLARLGNTIFVATDIELELSQAWFIPASALNALRRDAVTKLEAARVRAYRPPIRAAAAVPAPRYPESDLTYLGNVFNRHARAFYARHGITLIEDAYETNRIRGAVSLMITKHCLRYSFNLCPKQVKGVRPDPMTLKCGSDTLALRFDCKRCEMHVIGKMRNWRPAA
jgi:putative protease